MRSKKSNSQSAERTLANYCERLLVFTPDLLPPTPGGYGEASRKSAPEGLVDNMLIVHAELDTVNGYHFGKMEI